MIYAIERNTLILCLQIRILEINNIIILKLIIIIIILKLIILIIIILKLIIMIIIIIKLIIIIILFYTNFNYKRKTVI